MVNMGAEWYERHLEGILSLGYDVVVGEGVGGRQFVAQAYIEAAQGQSEEEALQSAWSVCANFIAWQVKQEYPPEEYERVWVWAPDGWRWGCTELERVVGPVRVAVTGDGEVERLLLMGAMVGATRKE